MILDEKKQIEVILLEYFRQTFGEFPKGKILPSESPDFILKQSARSNIGIELTRLWHTGHTINQHSGSNLFEIKFIEKVKEHVELYFSAPIFVKIQFAQKQFHDNSFLLSGSIRTAVEIRNSVRNKKYNFFCVQIKGNTLPVFVKRIVVIGHPILQKSIWEMADIWGKSDNTSEAVRHLIEKKNDKLRLYQSQNLKQCWLVITCDQIDSNNERSRVINAHYNSNYHKVFLFELMKQQVNVLM